MREHRGPGACSRVSVVARHLCGAKAAARQLPFEGAAKLDGMRDRVSVSLGAHCSLHCSLHVHTIAAGKVVLVTGASRGIGKSIAVALAGQGARVAVHYNTGKAGAADTVALLGGQAGTHKAFAVSGEIGRGRGKGRGEGEGAHL